MIEDMNEKIAYQPHGLFDKHIFISRSITALIQLIIHMGEDTSDEEIREEIAVIFDVVTHSKNKK